MPRHIDAEKLPAGLFWRPSKTPGKGTWWRYVPHPEDAARKQRKNVAGEAALMSELHMLMESGDLPNRGTVARVFHEFHESTDFSALSAGTRKGYKHAAAVIENFPTKLGIALGAMHVDRLTPPVFQRLVEIVAKGRPAEKVGEKPVPPMPTKANHLLRYARAAFSWGVRLGHCKTNPAKGVKQAKERKQHRMPSRDAFTRVLEFARARGALTAHTKGSVAPYLADVMEIAYGVRLRGIEVNTLTDAHHTETGIVSNRRKGSRDNITKWNPRLRAAWDNLVKLRAEAIARHSAAVPLRPEDRFLLVSQTADPLSKSSLDTAWQRLILMAIREGVIAENERFSLHGLKHRGVTDTPGKRSDRKDAAGHRTDAAFDIYDHDLDVVEPAGNG